MSGGLSADEVQRRVQTKTAQSVLDWCRRSMPSHPCCASAGQGTDSLGQAQWGCPPSWDTWEGEEGGRDSGARETECSGAGKASATVVDSRRESEKDPVAQRRLPFFPNESPQ